MTRHLPWGIIAILLLPMPAHAAPVVAFAFGLLGGGAMFASAFLSGLSLVAFSVGAFLGGTVLGSLLLNVGLSYLLTQKPKAPTIADARVNTRLADAPRWQAGGVVAVGGECGIFAEYDASGNLWYIVAHADGEIVGSPTYFLDSIPVELSDGTDGYVAGDVVTDAFCMTDDNNVYEGSGAKYAQFRIWTITPSVGHVYGELPALFLATFPALPLDFRLAGVAFSVLRIKSPPLEKYNSVYRWRGGLGLGEPAVSIVANWTRMYDPRNPAHDPDDRDTWTAGDGNPAIIWAWFRTAPYGRARPMSEINWDEIAIEADQCDEIVLDRTGTPIPRYRCGVAFPDNMARHECEAQILLSMDAFVVYDDLGRAHLNVGVYRAPTLSFSAARDILSAQTQIIDDGETALDGVVVNYISPEHGYTKQPCAPWVNSTYYDGSAEPNYQTVDVLACQNHNQAVRLAKAIGLRSASTKRAGIQTNIKGLLAASERTIDLDYDVNFAGDYEIVTPVEQDGSGMVCSFAVVPMQADRYDLVEGEEGAPPAPTPILDIDNSLAAAAGVVIAAVGVNTSTGAAVRLEATFLAPSRVDRAFKFRYAPHGSTVYEYFTTDMQALSAYSAVVADGQSYDVSWQTVTAGGRATDWSAVTTLTATADLTAPAALVSFAAADGIGASVVSFTTANDAHQAKVRIYRGTSTSFGSATLVATVVAAANVSSGLTNTGLAAGTYYFWGVPVNGSGVAGTASGPDAVIIT